MFFKVQFFFLESVFLQIMKFLISKKTKSHKSLFGSWMILKDQICKLFLKKKSFSLLDLSLKFHLIFLFDYICILLEAKYFTCFHEHRRYNLPFPEHIEIPELEKT